VALLARRGESAVKRGGLNIYFKVNFFKNFILNSLSAIPGPHLWKYRISSWLDDENKK
jgi:hypothetical protein